MIYIKGREFVLTGLTQREAKTVIRIVELLMELVPALEGTVVTHVE